MQHAEMNSTSENLINHLKELESKLIDFLKKYSGVKRTLFPGDGRVSARGNYSFDKLDSIAIPFQDFLYKEFNKIFELIFVLILDSPQEYITDFLKQKGQIEEYICQDQRTWAKNIDEVILESSESIKVISKIVSDIFPKSKSQPILVVDTNSLYAKPEIEKWSFHEFSKFEIAITPSVLYKV